MTADLLIALTVRVSLVLLVAIAASAFLRRRSAAVRRYVLATGICGALLIPLLGAVLPSWRLAVSPTASVAENRPSRSAESASTVSDVRLPASAQQRDARGAAVEPPRRFPDMGRLALFVWAAGAVLSLLALCAGLVRLWHLSRGSAPVTCGPWHDTLQHMKAGDRALRNVRLLRSDRPSLLIVWGWRRPQIVLPRGATSWEPARIRVVLEHEAEHVRHGDWLVQLAAEILRALAWFNPLAWFASSRLRLESERACDDAVIRTGIDGPDYAEHLVALARTLSTPRTILPAPAMARASSLERRVSAMLDHHVARRRITRTVRFTITALGLALVASIASYAAQAQFATLNGVVHDQLGGTIPKVTLRMTHALSGARHEITSNELGRFEFVGLPPGNYTLDTYAAGFKPLQQTLQLAGGQTLRQDLRVEVGTLQETILVRDGAAPPATVRPRPAAPAASVACSAEPNSGRLKPPLKTDDTRARYPESMRGTGVAGRVEMQAVIGLDGAVKTVRTVNTTNDDFAQAAADAVRQWKFTPTLLNCMPVEVEMNVLTVFTPEGAPPPPPPPPPEPPAPPAQR